MRNLFGSLGFFLCFRVVMVRGEGGYTQPPVRDDNKDPLISEGKGKGQSNGKGEGKDKH